MASAMRTNVSFAAGAGESAILRAAAQCCMKSQRSQGGIDSGLCWRVPRRKCISMALCDFLELAKFFQIF